MVGFGIVAVVTAAAFYSTECLDRNAYVTCSNADKLKSVYLFAAICLLISTNRLQELIFSVFYSK